MASSTAVSTFGIVDYIVLIATLVVSTGIGVYHACTGDKQSTTREFFLGNRNLSFIPIFFSLLASFVSATTLLGGVAEVYTFGSQQTTMMLGMCMVVPVVLNFFLPVFHELGSISVNEYLERRFNVFIRTTCSVIYVIQMILYLAVIIYTPSLILAQVTGINFWLSVIISTGICTFYTAIGGIKAAIWTDVLQGAILIAAICVIIIQGTISVGGMENVFATALKGKRVQFFNFSFDMRIRYTFWTQTIGTLFTTLPGFATNQSQIQRYLAARSLKTAKRALWGTILGWVCVFISTAVIAFIIYTRYEQCDPLSAGLIKRNDQLLPLFAMEVLGKIPGFPGLFVAGLLSGSLSTLSTILNSLGAVTVEDLLKPRKWWKHFEKKTMIIVKLLGIFYGIFCIGCMGIVDSFKSVAEAAIASLVLTAGPVFGVFVLGMFFPWTNSWGAFLGLLSGLIQSSWIIVGSKTIGKIPDMLPTSTEGCFVKNSTDFSFTYTNNFTSSTATQYLMSTSAMTDFPMPSLPTSLSETNNESFLIYLYSVSYMWYSLISCSTTIIMGLIVSFLTGPKRASDSDPRLFSPLTRTIINKIPKQWRRALLCDLDVEEIKEEEEKQEKLLTDIPVNNISTERLSVV